MFIEITPVTTSVAQAVMGLVTIVQADHPEFVHITGRNTLPRYNVHISRVDEVLFEMSMVVEP